MVLRLEVIGRPLHSPWIVQHLPHDFNLPVCMRDYYLQMLLLYL